MATHEPPRTGVTELIDRMSEGFLAVDDSWQIELCNDRARRILQRSGSSITGRRLWNTLPELVGTPFEERCRRAMTEGFPEIFETTVTAFDLTLSVRCFPAEEGLSIYIQDISLSRHRETELTRYVTVVEAVSDGLVVFDDVGTVTMVNEALESLLDASRGVIVGESVSGLDAITQLDPEDVAALDAAVTAIHDGATDRQLEFHLADDPDRVALEARFVPLPTGSSQSVAGVFRDITARHERERVITTLHDATRQLFRTADTREICATAVHTSANVLDLQTSGIWLLDEEHNRLEPIAATDGAREHLGGLPQFTDTEGLVWDVFRAGDAELFHDVSGLAKRCEFDVPIRSELIVPIGDRGVLMAGDPAPDTFDDHDLDLAELLAAHTEVALERGEQERRSQSQTAALEHRNRRLETIGELVTGPIADQLDTLESSLSEADSGADSLEALSALLEDVGAIAGTSSDPTAKQACSLADCVAAATRRLESQVTVDVESAATLRADREQFVRLLVGLVRLVHDDSSRPITVEVDSSPYCPRVDQLVVERSDRPSTTAAHGDETTRRIERAVVTRIARDHGWAIAYDPADPSTASIEEITTLSSGSAD